MTNKEDKRNAESKDEEARRQPTDNVSDDGIDYTLEGKDPGHEKGEDTAEGYDEAAHSGESRYGIVSGKGGVFGTSGGGVSDEGFQVIERPDVDSTEDRGPDDQDGLHDDERSPERR